MIPSRLRLFRRAGLYWRTVRHLKPVQVYGRVLAKASRLVPVTCPDDVVMRPGWDRPRGPFLAPHVETDGRRFRFLNQEHVFEERVDWDLQAYPKLWRYNLHYFEYLPSLPVEAARHLMEDWIARNPDGRSVGWDPYPLSLRMVHWFKWIVRHGAAAAGSGVLRSLYGQARYLRLNMEHHIQANHLFENAKALVWAGALFGGDEANGWLAEGCRLLTRELHEQVLEDGGHYERSPMYHAIVLEGLLDLLNLAPHLESLAPDLTGLLHDKAARMVSWLEAMCHPDGEIALFNDAAFGIAPPTHHLLTYAECLLGARSTSQDPVRHLEASGYVVIRSEGDQVHLAVDVGAIGPSYQPGHAHCDTLSFELSLQGERVFVDSGTGSYQDLGLRQRNRETAAHNTARVDGLEQSEIWGGFRVARRAEPQGVQVSWERGGARIQAEHTGFDHVGVRHQRCFRLQAGGLEIVDRFEGQGRHRLEVFFQLHPDLAVHRLGGDAVQLTKGDDPLARLEVLAGPEITEEVGTYCPEFGLCQASHRLRLEATGILPMEITTRIQWDGLKTS